MISCNRGELPTGIANLFVAGEGPFTSATAGRADLPAKTP